MSHEAGRLPSPAPCSPPITPSNGHRRRTPVDAILDGLGVDAKAALTAANTPNNKDALQRQTEEAAARGLFGAPSFTIGDELFWGNDRLEAALAWAKPPSPRLVMPGLVPGMDEFRGEQLGVDGLYKPAMMSTESGD